MWYDDQVSFLKDLMKHPSEVIDAEGGKGSARARNDFDGNNYISGCMEFLSVPSRKALLPNSGSPSSMATDDSVLWLGLLA